MDHETVKEKLFLYADPETGEEERRQIAAHTEGCEECRLLFKRWEQVQNKLSKTTLKPSASFVFQVMERLEPSRAKAPAEVRAGFPEFLRWLFPAVGYTAAFILMFTVITHREMPVNTETILLADMPHISQWTLGNQAPDAGDLVDI